MNKWSLESIGVVALGCRLNCLDPNLPEDSPVKKLIQCVHDLFAIQEFETKTKTDDEKGILEKLLEINEDFAYIMASDMLFAGVDTAANSITGALYLLAKNPDKQNKLREEVLSDPDKRPYLRACMREAIRMMPIVSGNMRLTTKEYNIMGYKIPSGLQVAFGHQDMSLMDEHFPRAKEFLPERWMADKDDPLYYRNAHPFAYNPFGFGARSCIARMVENFQVEWFGEPPKVVQTSLNYIKGPYNFILKDVKK
ncbi:Uncharacterized protein OBRU01_20720 [Operophtera brumata]|uniref:Cytochrome P450 n=1 Tax=Operophtera brumata TaxID=104452 RepID=A0A0L7KU83_OPEBR|nr:Uncharacterized protein OBRU01_20720 [Operophtera brumata]